MAVALYRKYRSRTLDEIAGQQHVTTLLANAVKSGRTAHAYLFTGPRGTGKTSIARILAHEINGIDYQDDSINLDIIEIDAASNNGVEDIRDLRDKVQIAPVSAKKKVYIIDEVHMLSKQAFNALLKTLEEPPEHVVFILATTDIDKVPETIISRTQRHTFRRATESDIVLNLRRIAVGESIDIDDEALHIIARHSSGSFRDSVSLFDQLVSGSDKTSITSAHVVASLGLVQSDNLYMLLEYTLNGNIDQINKTLLGLESNGIPPRTVAVQLADVLRRDIAAHPDYALLIDSLLDVSQSQYPELKLLTTLSLYSKSPLSSSPLEPQTVEIDSSSDIVREVAGEPVKAAKQTPVKQSQTSDKKQAAPIAASTSQPAASTTVKKTAKKTRSNVFDWDALIAHVRTHHVALYSVLSKCEPEIDGDTLKLYTKSAFYKKKLDEARYKQLLVDSLTELGASYDIETLSSAKPLKDSHAAQVAAIMGGGEEVSVDDA